MIKNFNRIENLILEIKSEKESASITNNRYPIRFIFLNDFEDLIKVVNLISKLNTKTFEISSILGDENLWITRDEIIEKIRRESKDGNLLVVGLSEYLRFSNKEDFFIIMQTLTGIENSNNFSRRIFIPLIGLWERFHNNFWDKFYRKEEWAPVWRLESSKNVKNISIYHIKFPFSENIKLDGFYYLKNNRDLLELWKRRGVSKIISFNNVIDYFHENFLPDQIFNLTIIENFKDFLEIIFNVRIPFNYYEGESLYWKKLLKFYVEKKVNNVEDIFKEMYNINDITLLKTVDFLKIFLEEREEFKKWFLKNYFLSKNKYENTYFFICLKNLKKLDGDSLLKNIWFKIFDFDVNFNPDENNVHLFEERKKLLFFMRDNFWNYNLDMIENKIGKFLKKIESQDFQIKSFYLTNITKTERKFIVESVKKGNIEEISQILLDLYPELFHYLNWRSLSLDEKLDKWVVDYFYFYNLSKVLNKKLNAVDKIVSEKNRSIESFSHWYYSFEGIINFMENTDDIIWIDSLGAEWFPLLIYFLEKFGRDKGIFIEKKYLNRANVPTTTKCNKKDTKKIEELDLHIHSQLYKYPDSLIEEIEIIKKIAKKIVELTETQKEIISDHGFTYLCIPQFGHFKRLDFSKSDHEGRCMKLQFENYQNDDYFIIWKSDEGSCNGEKYIVALKHFSLNRTPSREVHGGATPEEVLVPHIILKKQESEIYYTISPEEFEVYITNPYIDFEINPEPLSFPEAFIDNSPLIVEKISQNKFGINLKDKDTGNYSIQINVGNKKYILKVKIIGGMEEEEYF